MVRLRQVLNPLRVPRFPEGHTHNTFPRCQTDSGGIFLHIATRCAEKRRRNGKQRRTFGRKAGRFQPEPRSFWEETANSSKKALLRANELDGPQNRLISLDVTANDELDKLNCADNERDGLDLSHLPALRNLNRSLNRPHTLNLLREGDRREQQCSRSLPVVLHFRRHIAR